VPGLRLGVEERETIALGLARLEPFAEIARRMGRPTSTVSREVGRCGGRDGYTGRVAQREACGRARRPKVLKLVADPVLAGVVEVGLAKRWSPCEIAARLKVDHPDCEAMRVSHETIYTSLYLQGAAG
jgi:IS30 family transposase